MACGAPAATPAVEHPTAHVTMPAPTTSASSTTVADVPRDEPDDPELVAVGSGESDPSPPVAEPKCVEMPSISARVPPPNPLGVLEIDAIRLRSGCVWKSVLQGRFEDRAPAILGCFDTALGGKRASATRHLRFELADYLGRAKLVSLKVLRFPPREAAWPTRGVQYTPFSDAAFERCIEGIFTEPEELGSSRSFGDTTPVTLPAVVDVTLSRALRPQVYSRSR